MDILDRFADLLKSVFGDGGSSGSTTRGKPRFTDPDVDQAWEELDEYLGGGKDRESAEARSSGAESARQGSGRATGGSGPARGAVDEDLRQDYANLEVPFGADIDTVKRAYKSLIMRYHPDKHAGNPEKLRIATEITKKVNESFERIRSRTERRR